MNNGMVALKGYNKYVVDLQQEAVFRTDGRQIKVRTTATGKSYQLTRNDGKRKNIGFNRTMYAAMIGICPDTIPSDIYITKGDEGYQLVYRSDHCNKNHEIARANHINKWRNIMSQQLMETQMLIEYYDTGNASPLVQYIMSKHDIMAEYIYKKYRYGFDTSRDIASEVIEDICQRAVAHNLYVSSVSGTIRGFIRNVFRKRRRTVEYKD